MLWDTLIAGCENIQWRGGGGGAREIQARVSAGIGGGHQLQEGRSAGASGSKLAGIFISGHEDGGGVGVSPAANVGEFEEINGGMLSRTSQNAAYH